MLSQQQIQQMPPQQLTQVHMMLQTQLQMVQAQMQALMQSGAWAQGMTGAPGAGAPQMNGAPGATAPQANPAQFNDLTSAFQQRMSAPAPGAAGVGGYPHQAAPPPVAQPQHPFGGPPDAGQGSQNRNPFEMYG